jgi:hypothetical protein
LDWRSDRGSPLCTELPALAADSPASRMVDGR